MSRTVLACILVLAIVATARAEVAPQVVGGQPVQAGDFPFLVRVLVPNGYCSGSLIASNWVLTAAHCGLTGQPTAVDIADTLPGFLGAGHVVARLAVAEWRPHPGYNSATHQNDVALIKLAGNAFDSPPRYNGAPLYTPTAILLAAQPTNVAGGLGGQSIVAGFGRLDSGVGATVANWAFVPTHALAACAAIFGPLSATQQLCFGSYPNACQGDSGGPVFQAFGSGFILAGVVSFGLTTCGVGPTVAAYVPGYLSWITQQVQGDTVGPIQFGWELPPSIADGVATGISNAQGWAFSSAGPITSVRLERNGQHFLTLPCCAERGDVRNAIAGAPLLTGFSAAVNWGNFGNATNTFTIVIRDSAGNERRESRTVETVQILNGVSFARDLGFLQSTSCGLFNQGGRAFVECSRLAFQQGTCTGEITFGWHNGKQAFEVVEGCH